MCGSLKRYCSSESKHKLRKAIDRLSTMPAYSKIVIAGGGIIGNSIAYYLSQNHGTACTIIDPVGLAPAASGKAGGFLASTWSDHVPSLGALQRRSFQLHENLGELFGDKTDYRKMTCAAVAVNESDTNKKPAGRKLEGLEWADTTGILGGRSLGDETTIAQVHPKKLCECLWEDASSKVGSKLIVGKVVEAVLEKNKVVGVKLEDGSILEADALVVACGPWSDEAKKWFGKDIQSNFPRMLGVKYHSILVASPRVLSQAVFFQGAGDPEVYPRKDGDAYITGFPDPPQLVTESPGNEEVRGEVVDRLKRAMDAVSTELGGKDPHTKQACYLPTTQDGNPIIGAVPNVKGAFVASGHSCWGILNGPATGEAMAELLVHGKTSHVDISNLGLERFL